MDPRRTWTFQIPTRIVFGADASKQAGSELRGLGGSSVLVVTDRGVEGAGLLAGILDSLREAELRYVVYNGVEANPTIEVVQKGFEVYRSERCDCLLGVGGGSSMDTAKAIGVVATNPGAITEYFGLNKVKNALPPLVAVPTTCGTGSEVTGSAVVTDPERKFKMFISTTANMPRVALVDPLLLVNLPAPIVAATAMDALTHAVESYTVLTANPVSDALDLHAIKLIGENIHKAVANGDLGAIANLVLAATMAGMGFANTRLTIVHAMSHPLGGHTNMAHGLANAILLPHVMEFNLIGAADRFADVARALGQDTAGLSDLEAGELAVEAVRRMMVELGVPLTLKEAGVDEEIIPAMAEDAITSPNCLINPRRVTREHIVSIYHQAMG